MAALTKLLFDSSLVNVSAPPTLVQTDGYAIDDVLPSAAYNFYLYQANNWAGDFKRIITTSAPVISIPTAVSSLIYPFDVIQMTNAAGCAVTIELNALASGYLAIGQILTLWNDTPVASSYITTVSGDVAQPIAPGEYVRILIVSETRVLNLNDTASNDLPGDLFFTYNSTASRRGWLNYNVGETLGSTGSTATYKGARYQAAYYAVWNGTANAQCPALPSGRGANAAADYAANKTIALPTDYGCVYVNKQNTSPPYVNAQIFGADGVALTDPAMNALHAHAYSAGTNAYGQSIAFQETAPGSVFCVGIRGGDPVFNTGNIGPSGGSMQHENRQKSIAVYRFIKL